VVERLFAGLATGAAWPLVGSAHPIHHHLQNAALLDRAEDADAAVAWKPLFLDAGQNESLIILAEAMVPGATKAQVNRFIDLLLSVDTVEHQKRFVMSLLRFGNEAKKQFGREFKALPESDRVALLTNMSQDESRRPDFENLKEWIVGAYYSSEEGMRELGWDGKHAFGRFPGCEHAEAPDHSG